MNCPKCGQPLVADALTGEWRSCPECGPTTGKSAAFEVAKSLTIGGDSRRRRFEAGVVVVMIIVGVGYYMITSRSSSKAFSGETSIHDLAVHVEAEGLSFVGPSSVFNRQVLSYHRDAELLGTSLHLVSHSQSDVMETIIVVVALPQGTAYPANEVVERAVQKAFDEVVILGDELVPESSQALSLASENLNPVDDVQTPHLKGVALMDKGWRVTYIVYREYEQGGEAVPLMVFVYQHDAEDIDSDLADFNLALYGAIDSGIDVMAGLNKAVIH